jgi:hypothetical protein
MPTSKQLAANRRNAKKSTGPRTPEGKAAASRNALKTGIDAKAETMLPFEDPAKLEALTGEYYDRFTPNTPEERCLVDDLISDEWQLRRFRAIEGQLLTHHYDDAFTQRDVQLSLGQSYEYACKDLDRLQRRINATRKAYLATLKALRELQAVRPDDDFPAEELPEKRPPAVAQPDPAESLPPAIGFVPQSSPTAPALLTADEPVLRGVSY